jgi:hypothetical protein
MTLDTSSALAAAETLAEKGRFLEAIELLVDSNRRDPDPEAEVRLVRLRNLAFDELDRTPVDAPWPDSDPRPRDSDEPLPAIRSEELNGDLMRDQMLRYGCVYVPGLIGEQDVERLVEGIDRAFDGHDARFSDDSPPSSDTGPWFVPFEPTNGKDIAKTRGWVREGAGVWTAESPRVMSDFLEILERVGLRSLIREYLGERPALTLNKSTLRRVPALAGADWHQDGAFLGDGIRTVNLWLSLSRCGDDAPGLDLVPRRLDRIVETGTGGAYFDWSAGPETVERAAGDAGIVRPIFEPGDALLFDELFLHRTATDEAMTRERYAIETWFFAPSVYPGDQIPFVW